MKIYSDIKLDEFRKCEYLEDKKARMEYFYAQDLNQLELETLLKNCWRKFGMLYFRPCCQTCFECNPIRILVKEFKLSKSQRKLLRKNKDLKMKVGPLEYRQEIYEIYKEFSKNRFQQDFNFDDFISAHYLKSCPSLQSEYYLENKLIAVGFLDHSIKSLSSSYFIYYTEYKKLGLGIFSILKEIEFAKDLGLDYYYLGFYVKDNSHMNYKNRFFPHEIFNWNKKIWERFD